MEHNHCKICDYYDIDFNDEDYCEYWSELCKDIEDCDSRKTDEMG